MASAPPLLVDRSARYSVCAAIALTLGPMLPALPPEIMIFAVLPLLWQLWRIRRGVLTTPPHMLLLGWAAAAIATTVLRFGSIFGKQAGLALLAMLVGLKLLEGRTRRDAHVALQLCFFLQLGYFLVEQSALTALMAFGACTLGIVAMLRIERPATRFLPALGTGAALIATAIPLTALLFFLFPRLDSPLWGLPADSSIRTTGLSDRMHPGSIAELSLSGAIAFRVEFKGRTPPPPLRYFRGPVLTDFDGQDWRPAPPTRPLALPPQGPATDYVITLEPHQQRWLLALDHAVPLGEQSLDADNVLVAREPILSRTRLNVRSVIGAPIGMDANRVERDRALNLPPELNPRTRAVGADLLERYPDPAQRVAAAATFFSQAELTYTLTPPPLGRDVADDFLFVSKRGFCEHFANSYVIMMRAAGVPARVVTGYQGGDINPIDHTLVVRQSDAHAWAEVWLAGQGWVRQDPTAIAAPRRINDGLNAALPAGEPVSFITRADAVWLRALRDRAEAVAHAWNVWVLGYNSQRQQSLMRTLGFDDPDWRTLVQLLIGALGVWQGCVVVLILRRRVRRSPAERAWLGLESWLARRGFVRAAHEGPLDFAARIGLARPAWADSLTDLAHRYAQLKYGPPASPGQLESLVTAIKTWKKQHASGAAQPSPASHLR